MKLALGSTLLLLSASLFAQNIPVNPNTIDAKGFRQGKWTVWFNKNWKPTANRDSLTYYRIIEYKDDKPTGVVKDYYKSGKLQMEASYLADRPKEVIDDTKPSHYYTETGQEVIAGGNIPVNKNIKDANGLRQGWWTLGMNESLTKRAVNKKDVFFYRIIEFKDDKPVGEVKDYYPSGVLYQELTLSSFIEGKSQFFARVDYSQPYRVYWPDGSENLIAPNRIQCEMLTRQGKYELALPFAEKALAATEKRLGKKDWRYQYFLMTLGRIHQQLGNYTKAESLYQEAIKMDEDGTSLGYTEMSLQFLANLYSWMGNYPKIEPLLKKALIITEKNAGKESLRYASLMNDMGNMYSTYDSKKAEEAYLEAIKIKESQFGKAVSTDMVTLNNLAMIYQERGRYSQARPLIEQALTITENEIGKEGFIYATCLDDLAALNESTGNFSKAVALYHQALEAYERSVGQGNLPYLEAVVDLAVTYEAMGEIEMAEPWFLRAKESYLNKIENFFPMLSEFEKEAFYRSVNYNFERFNSYCLLRKEQNSGILGEMYNNQLATKALLLNSASKWKQRIRNSGDKKLFALYTEWESNQGILARWYKDKGGNQNKQKIDSLENLTTIQEKELSRRSELFASISEKRRGTWQEVQAKLKPNEVAIEMIRVKKFGVWGFVTDSSDSKLPRYPRHGLTDTIYYAALLLTNTSSTPELVLLKNGNDLENKYLKLYSNSIRAQTEDDDSYNQFWKPIAEKLGKLYKKKSTEGIRVYFSADGVFNQINLNTLFNPATHKYVLEETKISLVTNTKDLLVAQKEEAYNNLAYLFGYPDYGISVAERNVLVKKERDSQPVYYALALERGSNNLSELPGTKTEVENISNLMIAKGWQPEVLIGDKALEETLKDCFKPRVLHIATHGYFQPDATSTQNPLLRSGLMLAGAAQTLDGNKDDKTEDGILTAYEAMNLNLDNTDLVVLSACETGLGSISNGEGVYGLQRAFRVAGAKTIIMSLWKVDDQATQELMTSFYENWLNTGNKRQSFEIAQQNIKMKYKAPYFWGAFVMVGE